MKNDMNDIAECPICKRVLLRNTRNFYRAKTMKSGFDSHCKKCRNQKTSEQKVKKEMESPRKRAKSKQYRKPDCLDYDKCLLAAALLNEEDVNCSECRKYEKGTLVPTSSYQNGYEIHLDIDKEL